MDSMSLPTTIPAVLALANLDKGFSPLLQKAELAAGALIALCGFLD
jgi:hypothetical protein